MQPIILDVDSGLVRFCLNAIPKYSLPVWFCWFKRFNEAIWHRVFPPELWGPYGPWERVRVVIAFIASPITRLFRGGK